MFKDIISLFINHYLLLATFLGLSSLACAIGYGVFLRATNQKLNLSNTWLQTELNEANHALAKRGTAFLEEELSLVRATMESRRDGIIVLNEHNKIIDYNSSAIKLLNLDEALLQNGQMHEVIKTISSDIINVSAFKEVYDESLKDKREDYHIEMQFPNDKIIEFYSYSKRYKGKYIGKVLQFRDLTKIKLNESKLMKRVNLDSLTQLPNRELLIEMATQSIRSAVKNRLFLAILTLDIDKFNRINDHIGQVMADKLLQSLAQRLQENAEGNFVARISANTFSIIYMSGKHVNDVADFAKNTLELLNEPYYIEGHKVLAPASMGIAIHPKDGDEADVLLKNADIAMRRAKNKGGSTSEFFTDALNKKYRERLMIDNHLRNALKLNEFSLLYHPILNAAEKKIIGVEVLLRWYHPILGDISPAVFVPVAEQNGMIADIGYWILHTGLEQLKKWHALGYDYFISFNLSKKQFIDPAFIEKLQVIIAETDVNPKYIAIEITEQTIMENVQEKIFMLNTLKKIGVQIIVDDFGTGYSCLNILNELPIDRIKIDSTFVDGIPNKADSKKMINCISTLAELFNFGLIAEGVTNEKQEKFLLDLHCTEMQGFHYYKPLSAELMTREAFANAKAVSECISD